MTSESLAVTQAVPGEANDVEQHGRWAGRDVLTVRALGTSAGRLSSRLPAGSSQRRWELLRSKPGVLFAFLGPRVGFGSQLLHKTSQFTQAQPQFLQSGSEDMEIHWVHQPADSAAFVL